MVDVGAFDDGDVVGEQLQGDREQDRVEHFGATGQVDHRAFEVAGQADIFVGEDIELAAPGADLGKTPCADSYR